MRGSSMPYIRPQRLGCVNRHRHSFEAESCAETLECSGKCIGLCYEAVQPNTKECEDALVRTRASFQIPIIILAPSSKPISQQSGNLALTPISMDITTALLGLAPPVSQIFLAMLLVRRKAAR